MRGLTLVLLVLLGVVGCRGADLSTRWPGQDRQLRIPTYHQEVLPSGLTLIVHEDPYLPLCVVRLTFRRGAAAVPTTQSGLPALTYAALRRDVLEPADGSAGAAALGVDLALHVDQDGASVGAQVTSATVPVLLRHLGRALRAPAVAPAHVQQARDELRWQSLREERTPTSAGLGALRQVLYGPTHPLGQPVTGDPATLSRLGPTEVRDFHQRALRPQYAALVLVGRINPAQARALAEEALAGWTAEGGAAPELPMLPPRPAAAAPIYLVSWPGLPQALLLGGRVLPNLPRDKQLPTKVLMMVLAQEAQDPHRNLHTRYDAAQDQDWLTPLVTHRSGVELLVLTRCWGSQVGRRLDKLLLAIREMDNQRTLYGGRSQSLREALIHDSAERVTGLVAAAREASQLFQRSWPLNSHLVQMQQAARLTGTDLVEASYQLFDRSAFRFVVVGDPATVAAQLRGHQVTPINR